MINSYYTHPDIVSILTFCSYSGTVSNPNKMFFTGLALNRIESILLKYFNVSYYENNAFICGVPVIARKMYITNRAFVQGAYKLGWRFKKNIINRIPDYVFNDINLFRVMLSILIDCKASISFNHGRIHRKGRVTLVSGNLQEWDKLRHYLDKYNLPAGRVVVLNDKKIKCHNIASFRWTINEMYSILNFIGWDLQRPWNARVLKYLRENYEVSLTPKRYFL